jgi:GT2 family glycosyltransferase
MSDPAEIVPQAALNPVRRRRQRRCIPTEAPRLSVIIVNYCQWENTAALVRQVLRTPAARRGEVEVLVVDNHSPWHPLAARLRRWPGVSLRRWGRNRGFARAVNEGCRLSRGQWFLVLNPDLTLTEGFIDGVLTLLDQEKKPDSFSSVGIVGFQLLNGDGSRQRSCGYFPTLLGTVAGLVRRRANRKYRELPTWQRARVPWVSGCCLLLRRECAQELGGLDASFFLYYEDVDLCRRARARGWSVWYEPRLSAIHHQPLHRRIVSPKLRLLTRHALLTYGLRHWPGWQFAVLGGIVRLEATVRRMSARWTGDTDGAKVFATMGALVRDMLRGREVRVRRAVEKKANHGLHG